MRWSIWRTVLQPHFPSPKLAFRISSVSNWLGDFGSAQMVFTAHVTLPSPHPPGRGGLGLGLTTMWHEARKHERKLRGMMVDYKKRAERRREYYEKIVSARPSIRVGSSPEGGSPVILVKFGPGNTSEQEPRFLGRIRIHFSRIITG